MAKALGYEEFIEYAKKHYNRGGDSYVECWDEATFDEDVRMFGPITKRKALGMFRDSYEIDRDRRGWGW